jgi:glycosyltransferase involved in cell wall biosynthesis
MDLLFFSNARLSKVENGDVYGYHSSLSYASLTPYLNEFSKIYVVARVENVKGKEFNEAAKVNGSRIEVLEIPYYIGPKQFLKSRASIKKLIKEYVAIEAAVICRIPGTIGNMAAKELQKINKPYAVEVAADPFDVFAPGGFNHPLRIFFRYRGLVQLRNTVKKSSAALYVTAQALQKRYPVTPGTFSISASDVVLPEEAFVERSRQIDLGKSAFILIALGSLDQMYKSPDVMLEAAKQIRTKGLNVKVVWLGDGRFKDDMILLSEKLGIAEHVNFAGAVKPASLVRDYLDKADIYIQPSRTEGLPRALVEAMARGLPCIGTSIGGIPELLEEPVLIPKNDADALAKKLIYMLENPTFANEQAIRNLEIARQYAINILTEKRSLFFKKISGLTTDFYHLS